MLFPADDGLRLVRAEHNGDGRGEPVPGLREIALRTHGNRLPNASESSGDCMTCRTQATLDRQTPRPFVHHDLDFTQPTPTGFAQCRRCEGFFTMEQYAAWRCDGTPAGASVTPRRAPLPLHGIPCALCGDPVLVDPMHRAVVEWFGACCDTCFNLEPAHV